MAEAPNKLGEAVIVVRVDDSGVGPGIAMAQSKAASAGSSISGPLSNAGYVASIEAMQNRTAIAAGRMAQDIEVGPIAAFKKATSAVTSLMGRISAVGAVATVFYQIGKAISEGVIEKLKTATDKADEFRESLDFTKAAESAAILQQKINELNATGNKRDRETAQELQQTLISVQGAANAKELRAREKKASDEKTERVKKIAEERDAAQKIAEDAELAALDGEEKVIAQRDRDIDALVKKQRATNDAATAESYRRAIEARYAQADKELAIFSEQKKREEAIREEEYRSIIAQNEKAAAAVTAAFQRGLQDVRNNAAQLFPTDQIVTSLEAVVGKLTQIANQTRSRL